LRKRKRDKSEKREEKKILPETIHPKKKVCGIPQNFLLFF
jgi:hypothetical protein